MGRTSSPLNTDQSITLERVPLDSGGYDPGGAYWGSGGRTLPLWCAYDEDGNAKYVRAKSRQGAIRSLPEITEYVTPSGESDMMLSDEILLEAGHPLYCSAYVDEWGERENSFGPGAQIDDEVDQAPPDRLLPIMRQYEQELADAWGSPPATIFRLMGLDDDSRIASALYYVLMSCRGSGVGIGDGDFDEELDAYLMATGKPLDESPMNTELMELRDLANEIIEEEGDWR
jgi:hypothetical protein